jgi:hypothetical protein
MVDKPPTTPDRRYYPDRSKSHFIGARKWARWYRTLVLPAGGKLLGLEGGDWLKIFIFAALGGRR